MQVRFAFIFLFVGWVNAAAAAAPTDPEANMCSSYLSKAYIFNSTCKSNITCLCDVSNFVETLVSCIDNVHLQIEHNNSTSKQNQSYASVHKFCKSVPIKQLEAYHNNGSKLAAYNGNTQGVNIGSWRVKEAFKPSKTDITLAYNGYQSKKVSTPRITAFGSALLGYWAGILLLHTFFNVIRLVAPGLYGQICNTYVGRLFRKYLVIPSTSSYLSTNIHSLEIFGFVVLTMVFSFAHLPMSQHNYYYSFKQAAAYGAFCGIRTGYLCLYIMPLMILFAGRNNILQAVTGLSQDLFITYHRWIGRIVVILILIHAIAYSISSVSTHKYVQRWNKPYWQWGVVALTFACVIFVQASRYLRRKAYEIFLVIHIICAILFIVGGYYHLRLLNSSMSMKFYWATIAVWAFDRAFRLLRIATSNFRALALVKAESNMLVVTIPVPKWWKLHKRPGSYVFIHFLHAHVFFQSHPFTMSLNPNNSDELKLVCRVKDGVTKKIYDCAMKNGGEWTSRICLDGPYGHSSNFTQFDELIFFAGGVGITAPFSYIQGLLQNDFKKDQRIRLIWAVRDLSAESWYEPELEMLRSHSNVQVDMYTGGESEKLQVLDVPTEVEDVITNCRGKTLIFCCGPEGMAKAVRNTVAKNLTKTRHLVEYVEESFSW